eukprot:1150517-Amphidinium_carterae.1
MHGLVLGIAVLPKLPSNRALDGESRTPSQKRGFELMRGKLLRVQRRVAQFREAVMQELGS